MSSFKIATSPLTLLLILTACGDSGGTPTTESASTSDTTGPADTTGTDTDPVTTGEPDTTDTAGTPTTGVPDPTTGEPDLTTGTTAADSTGDDTGPVAGDCDFDDAVVFARDAAVWQLESDDGETCVWLERRDDSEPDVIYKAVPYTLLALRAGHEGLVESFADPMNLAWTSTHHNWADVAEAWSSDVRYTLVDQFGITFGDDFELTVIDEQSKAVLWGPVLLHPYTP